jgi:hypothetical protein
LLPGFIGLVYPIPNAHARTRKKNSMRLEREQNPHKILNRKANRMARWQKSFIAREYYGVSQE